MGPSSSGWRAPPANPAPGPRRSEISKMDMSFSAEKARELGLEAKRAAVQKVVKLKWVP